MNEYNKPSSQNQKNNLQDDEIIIKAAELSKDHAGSRLVQKKYEELPQELRDKIFENLKPNIYSLVKDVFGNYVIQKILEFKEEQKDIEIYNSLKNKFLELSTDMYGCRVVQKLLNILTEE